MMKFKIIITQLFLLASFLSFGQNRSVKFYKSTLKDVLELAEKEKKMVFIDFYTDWCAPCKTMDKEVFTNDKVADYMNNNFISFKVDAEKGEGISLSKETGVKAYPTFVVLERSGKELLRLTGATSAVLFQENLMRGLDAQRSPAALKLRYEKGERNPLLVNDYAFSLMKDGKEKEGYEVVNTYFKSLSVKGKASPENWFLYDRYTTSLNDEKASYLLANQKKISSSIGGEKVEAKINTLLRSQLLTYLSGYKTRSKTFDAAEYTALKNKIAAAQFSPKYAIDGMVRISDILVTGNIPGYVEQCVKEFPLLSEGNRFSIMLNLGLLVKGETQEIKTKAANLIEQNLSIVKDETNLRIIKRTANDLKEPSKTVGIQFETGSFAQALKKAKESGRLIFMDAYTSWCGPCKIMSENVFPDKEVGDFFNTRFVNVKIDMEKGEGPELMKRYPIVAFPTLLLIDGDGNEVHRIVGGYEKAPLIAAIIKGMKKENSLSFLKQQYAEGNREPALMIKLAAAMNEAYQKKELAGIIAEFFASLTEKQKLEKEYSFVYRYASKTDDPKFDYFLKNEAALLKSLGTSTFESIVDQVCVPQIMNYQINFKKKDFWRNTFPQLYKIKLSGNSETKVLMDLIDIIGDGNIDKQIAYQQENILKLGEKNRILTLYQLLAIPDKGTDNQKKELTTLLKKALAAGETDLTPKSLNQFLERLENPKPAA